MPTDIELALSAPEALFAAPDPDPLAPGFACMSGMDRVFAETSFRSASRLRGARLVLRPGAGAPPFDEARLGRAVAAYCAARASALRLERAALRREGLQTLGLAAVFIAVVVLLAAGVRAWIAESGLLPMLVRDGLVIAGWVALWRPIDILLFETWLLRRQQRVLAAVAAMPVVVRP